MIYVVCGRGHWGKARAIGLARAAWRHQAGVQDIPDGVEVGRAHTDDMTAVYADGDSVMPDPGVTYETLGSDGFWYDQFTER